MKTQCKKVVYFLCFLFLPLAAVEASEQKKVVFLTVPKAGTHLLKAAAEKMGKTPIRWLATKHLTAQNVAERVTDRYSFVHLSADTLPIFDLDPELYTVVLLVRDPRDVLISFLHHILDKGNWISCQETYHSDWLESLSYDEQVAAIIRFPLEANSPCSAVLLAAQQILNPQLTIIRFEDLVGKQGGGSDEAQKQTLQLVAKCMGVKITDQELEEIQNTLFGHSWSFRKGQIGQWPMSYSHENKALFKSVFGQATMDLGYAADLNW